MVHSRHTRARHTRSRPLAGLVASLTVVLLATACATSGGGGNGSPFHGRPGPYWSPVPGPVDPEREPRSTFAIDIDTASYNFARRQILDGVRPDPQTVRPEEFLNAFRQDYPQPAGTGFTVSLDGSRLPREHHAPDEGPVRLLRVGLQTRGEDPTVRPDAALTFVVDVSGSMAEPGRLDLVQDALHTLVDQLRNTDSVAIVAYETDAHVLREMTAVHSRPVLHRAIDRLAAGGATNLEAGLVTGYQVARAGFIPDATNRVILLSDGLANVGNTQAEPILRQIREEAAKKIALLGVGVGSEYGDALMERLADEGDGFVTYVSEREQARQLFVHRLPATLTIRALDAKVQVTFDPTTVASYRLIGYDDRALAASDFRNDHVDGGEVGPGHSVTALYLVQLRARAGLTGPIAEARVHWFDPDTREPYERAATIDVEDLAGDFAGGSPRLQVCYVAAYFAEQLRHSRYAEEIEPGVLRVIAGDAYHATDDPQVRELADLIGRMF
ncbi:MAG: YfbK domain-containing protein [Micromonosporaceae bacterium]